MSRNQSGSSDEVRAVVTVTIVTDGRGIADFADVTDLGPLPPAPSPVRRGGSLVPVCVMSRDLKLVGRLFCIFLFSAGEAEVLEAGEGDFFAFAAGLDGF